MMADSLRQQLPEMAGEEALPVGHAEGDDKPAQQDEPLEREDLADLGDAQHEAEAN